MKIWFWIHKKCIQTDEFAYIQWNYFFKLLYCSESYANLKQNQLRSCDKNTTWWRSTFWANYRGEWEWSVVQECALRRDVDMKVSTVSWKPRVVVIERFVVRHKSKIFCSQLLFNMQQKFRLRTHDQLIRYTNDLLKITLQHTDKFDCRVPPLSHYCAMF